jgi:hypothetical protein
MERREFIAKAGILATWASIPITISACSDDDGDGGPTGPDSDTEDVPGVVTGSDHPHNVRLTGAQIDAQQNVQLTLTGSGHTHTVSLTAQEVADVADGEEVVKTSSSTLGHEHTVTFNGTPAQDVTGVVTGSNHTHAVRLTGVQIDAEQNVTLTLTGSGHTHTVELAAQEVVQIGDGAQVVKTSSFDEGHDHTVTFN